MNSFYKVGIYIRLSKEDIDKEKDSESESIMNQRKLISKYLNEEGLVISGEYIDDGYSGTNFNRPGFMNLVKDIESQKINMVITKDLSRLGRDYIKTGYYIEDFFPSHKVRYVSILDGIDTKTDTTNNDIAPFKAVFNDMISKDTSKKIRSILKNKKEQGLFLGSKAPYGYMKDPSNKHKLIICEETSKIVKKIFNLSLQGKSNRYIADYLNAKEIASPNRKKWTASSVHNILSNEEYTGCLISNVWTNISYKNKTRVKRFPSEWIKLENTQEVIINKKIFYRIKNRHQSRNSKLVKRSSKLLLEGLVYCGECGCLLGINYLKKRDQFILMCNRYKRDPSSCTPHYINYQKLEMWILSKIKTILSKIKPEDLQKIIQSIKKNGHKVEKYQEQLMTLKGKLKCLYEDRLNEVIDIDTYQEFSKTINCEIKEIENHIEKNTNKDLDNIQLCIDRNLLLLLINKIEINCSKEIKITYNFKMLS